jgi:hypothetical protein
VMVRKTMTWYSSWGILYGEDDCVYMVVSGHIGHSVNKGDNPQPGELVILRSVERRTRNVAGRYVVRGMTASDRHWVIDE